MRNTIRYAKVLQSDFTPAGLRYTAVMDDISLCEEEGQYFIWTQRKRGDSVAPSQSQMVSDPTNALIALEEYQTFVKRLEESARLEAKARAEWLHTILQTSGRFVVEVLNHEGRT